MVFGKFLDVYICVGLSCNLMYVGDYKKKWIMFFKYFNGFIRLKVLVGYM